MLEMLKERKAALEARGKKGFTLMEMLIVIAIIAVLVAIAIPVLGAQLDRARATTDEANIRDGYASMQVQILQPYDKSGNKVTVSGTYTLQKDGSVKQGTDNTDPYECQGSSASLGGTVEVGGVDVGAWDSQNNKYIIFTVSTDGSGVSSIAGSSSSTSAASS